jgi:hypothetical protein
MFSCERCGSRYSATHVAPMQNCPRCQIRDRVSVPLYFKPFTSIAQTGGQVDASVAQASGRVPEMTPAR